MTFRFVNIDFCVDDKSWQNIFYRNVDGGDGAEGSDIRRIEEKVFIEIVKNEVVQILGDWQGRHDQNKLADQKVAYYVKNSFKVYEKNLKKFEKSYFKF